MAVSRVPQSTVMSIKVQSGVTASGSAAYKTTRFTLIISAIYASSVRCRGKDVTSNSVSEQ